MSVKLHCVLTEHNLEFLGLKGGCTGSSESTLPHVEAHSNNDSSDSTSIICAHYCMMLNSNTIYNYFLITHLNGVQSFLHTG